MIFIQYSQDQIYIQHVQIQLRMAIVGQSITTQIIKTNQKLNISHQLNDPIDFSEITKKHNILDSIKNFAYQSKQRLKKTILGDYEYQPKNKFPIGHKKKIFEYLRTRYITTLSQLQQQEPKKFTRYDPQYGMKLNFLSLKNLKQVWLKLNTNIQAAQDSLRQYQISERQIKAEYFNQIAYQFDKQRKVSAAWGLLLGAIICSTVYKRGSNIRRAALFITLGHVFSQISYRWNIDKQFDCVYSIFQQDAVQFVEKQQRQKIKQQERKIKGESKVED